MSAYVMKEELYNLCDVWCLCLCPCVVRGVMSDEDVEKESVNTKARRDGKVNRKRRGNMS